MKKKKNTPPSIKQISDFFIEIQKQIIAISPDESTKNFVLKYVLIIIFGSDCTTPLSSIYVVNFIKIFANNSNKIKMHSN